MKRLLVALSFAVFLFPALAYADAPAIASFSAYPTTVSYAIGTQLSWDIPGGGAPDFYFTCPVGVSAQSNGGSISCNATVQLSSFATDNAGLSFVNVTGSTQTVLVRMTPKDTSGTAYPDNARIISLYVGAVPIPLSSFTSSATSSVASGSSVTFTWAGNQVPGTNMQFDCVEGITIYSGSTKLECGKPAFSTDLSQSGTQSISFVNGTLFPLSLGVHLMPSVVLGSYDATHSLSLSLTVKGAPVAAGPTVSNFTVTPLTASSGIPVTFSWNTASADSVNLQFGCAYGIAIKNTDGSNLQCGVPAFATDFATVGSTSVSFINPGVTPAAISVLLLPRSGNYYDATHARSLPLTIQYAGYTPTVPTPPPTPIPQTPTTPAPQQSGITVLHTLTFSVFLQKGSRGAQVTALQQFLAQDPTLYPEGLATGYYGVATDAAVKRFQVRYGIATPGQDGYGYLGPKTRAKLNSITQF